MDRSGLSYQNELPEWILYVVLSTCNAFHLHGMADRSETMHFSIAKIEIDFLLWCLEMTGWVLLLVQKILRHKTD